MENILSEQVDHHIVLGRMNSLAVTRNHRVWYST